MQDNCVSRAKPGPSRLNYLGAATWLLTELDSEDPDIAFGLCDLGMQCPELGSVRISGRKLRETHIGTRGTVRWVSRGSEVGVPWFRLVFRGSA